MCIYVRTYIPGKVESGIMTDSDDVKMAEDMVILLWVTLEVSA